MEKLSKEKLWKALKEPSTHRCGNCKFIQSGDDVYCEDCSHYHHIAQAYLWEDKWGWDGKTK